MAGRTIIPVGRVQVATPSTMALAIRALTEATDAVDERIADVAADIIANDPTLTAAAQQAAIDAINQIVSGYFATTPSAGMYTFPNADESAPAVSTVKFAVDPAQITPTVSSFHGRPTTSGGGTITVLSPNTDPGTWGNSIDPAAQQVTSGGSGVYCLVNVGGSAGVSAVRVRSLSSTPGGLVGMGGVTAFRFESGVVAFLRWTIGSSGKYAIQRYVGTSLSSGSFTTLSQTSMTAQANDLVEFEWISADGLVVLTVNGATAAVYQLPVEQRATHNVATYAGSWGHGANLTSNKLGGWQWKERVSTGTVKRRMPSTGADNVLSPSVILAPEQKRQAVGPVFDIRDYGAKVDAIYLTDARTQAGAPYVWSDSRTFTAEDVGKRIAVKGAGPVVANANDGVWLSTIIAIEGSAARLNSNATSTVSGARCVFGTPDDVAMARAQIAAVRAGGGTVYFPPGRTIATVPLLVQNFVSWAGYTRNTSWVHILADRPGNASTGGTCDWLSCAGRGPENPLIGAEFRDFGINAEFMIHTEGYGSALKPLDIFHVQRCSIQRMNVWNTPATSIPFDVPYDHVTIRDNFVLNPGRLAPAGVGPGGSGIGVGTIAKGALESMVIENNTVVGTVSASSEGTGQNGIFVEANGEANPDAGVSGYRIVNNLVVGMPVGITDAGSNGTIIKDNIIVGCAIGVRVSATTIPASYPGLDTKIVHNFIWKCTGPAETDGVGVAIFTQGNRTNIRGAIHALVEGNHIVGGRSWGIRVNAAGDGPVDVDGIVLRGNIIRENGRSGIRLESGGTRKLRYAVVKDNQLVSNGKRAIAGDAAGVHVVAGTTLEGGRIQDNDIYDLAGTPTQVDRIVTTGATLTGVRVAGNTGDA